MQKGILLSFLALTPLFYFILSGNVIQVNVSSNILKLQPGDPITVMVGVNNIEEVDTRDYILRTKLLDSEGNLLFEKSQTVAISNLASFVVSIPTSTDMKEGNYVILSQLEDVKNENIIASASTTITLSGGSFFNQKAQEALWSIWVLWLMVIALFIFTIVLFIEHKRNRNRFLQHEEKIKVILAARK